MSYFSGVNLWKERVGYPPGFECYRAFLPWPLQWTICFMEGRIYGLSLLFPVYALLEQLWSIWMFRATFVENPGPYGVVLSEVFEMRMLGSLRWQRDLFYTHCVCIGNASMFVEVPWLWLGSLLEYGLLRSFSRMSALLRFEVIMILMASLVILAVS